MKDQRLPVLGHDHDGRLLEVGPDDLMVGDGGKLTTNETISYDEGSPGRMRL